MASTIDDPAQGDFFTAEGRENFSEEVLMEADRLWVDSPVDDIGVGLCPALSNENWSSFYPGSIMQYHPPSASHNRP
jgi:hypothetical protein